MFALFPKVGNLDTKSGRTSILVELFTGEWGDAEPPANGWPQATINALLEPLFTPSGIWADYNPVYLWYKELLRIQTLGILDKTISITPPLVTDYTNYTSVRSFQWPTGLYPTYFPE